jgi:hypothetical protein
MVKYFKILVVIFLMIQTTIIAQESTQTDAFVGVWKGKCANFEYFGSFPDSDVTLTITKQSGNQYELKFAFETKTSGQRRNRINANLANTKDTHLTMEEGRIQGTNVLLTSGFATLKGDNKLEVKYSGDDIPSKSRGVAMVHCFLEKSK